MKFSTTVLALGTAGLLSACMQEEAGVTDAALVAQVAGKTAVSAESSNRFNLNADGTISGEGINGRWEIVNGQWCRELTAGGREFPYECQGLTITGNQMVITRADGSVAQFTLE